MPNEPITETPFTRLRRLPRLVWIPAAAAVVAVIAILAGLLMRSAIAPAIPAGPPPAGVNVFYVADPRDPAELDAYDWTGKLRGKLRNPRDVTRSLPGGLDPAPDGSSFLFTRPDTSVQWIDRSGRPFGKTMERGFLYRSHRWSADSRGICRLQLADDQSAWQLTVVDLHGGIRVVVSLPFGPGPAPITTVVACSFADDRALLEEGRFDNTGQHNDLLSIVLSTAAVTIVSPAQAADYHASPTGSVVAEDLIGLGSDGKPRARISTLGSGQGAADVPLDIYELSGDGSLVMGWATDGQRDEIVDWRTGRVVWSYTEQRGSVLISLGEPGGNRFVTTVAHTCQPPCSPFVPAQPELIVNPDGSTISLPGNGLLW